MKSLIFGFGLTYYSHNDLIELHLPTMSSTNSVATYLAAASSSSQILQDQVILVKPLAYKNTPPTPRNGCGYAYRELDDSLLLFGGHVDDEVYPVFDIWKLNFQTMVWQFITTIESSSSAVSLRSVLVLDTYFVNAHHNTLVVHDLNQYTSICEQQQQLQAKETAENDDAIIRSKQKAIEVNSIELEMDDGNSDEKSKLSPAVKQLNKQITILECMGSIPVPDEDFQITTIMGHYHYHHMGKIPTIFIMGGFEKQDQVIELMWNAPYSARMPHKLYNNLLQRRKAFCDVITITCDK